MAASASQGALIDQVGPNTPAAQAGLRPNDVIGAIDRQAVLSTADLIRIIGGYNPGAIVEVLVIRQGRPQAFRVQLAGQGQTEAPQPPPSGAPPSPGPSASGDIQPPWLLSPIP